LDEKTPSPVIACTGRIASGTSLVTVIEIAIDVTTAPNGPSAIGKAEAGRAVSPIGACAAGLRGLSL